MIRISNHFTCTAPNCGVLPNPENGAVLIFGNTVPGAIAEYFCSSGFLLEGGFLRFCQGNGMWSGAEPTCRGIL